MPDFTLVRMLKIADLQVTLATEVDTITQNDITIITMTEKGTRRFSFQPFPADGYLTRLVWPLFCNKPFRLCQTEWKPHNVCPKLLLFRVAKVD